MNVRHIVCLVRAACLISAARLPAAVAGATPVGPPPAGLTGQPAAGDAAPAADRLAAAKPAGGGRWSLTGQPEELLDRLQRGESPEPLTDPLRTIAGDMGGLVTDLGAYKTDQPVQQKQAHVVRTLDMVIKELEKQCKAGSGGAGGGKPLGQSKIVSGPGGQGPLIDPKQGEKQWAALPAKQREQILQSQTEGFPPGYETILQSYYRRLSQEQVTPDAPPAGGDRPAGPARAAPAAAQPAATPTPKPATP